MAGSERGIGIGRGKGKGDRNRNSSTKVVFAQTPILESQLEALKRMSGAKATKDALQASINHFLSCPLVRDEVRMREEEEGERKVVRKKGKDKDWWWFPGEDEGGEDD